MIRHIVVKDLRLLGLPAAGVAAVNIFNAALLMSGGAFARAAANDFGEFAIVSNLVLPAVAWVGLAFLVISVIHLDRLPGSSQDWLTRPIKRADLVAAKLVFMLVAGLMPMFLCDVALGLADRFDVSAVLAASLSRSVGLFCFVCVPAALVAAVTATLSEALVFVVGLVVVLIAELLIAIEFKPFVAESTTGFATGFATGFGWISLWMFGLLNVVVLLLAVPLQLRWRTSNRLRWILLVVLSVEPLIAFIPVSDVLSIQQAVAPAVAASLHVDADRGKALTFRDFDPRGFRQLKSTVVSFPLRVVGAGQTDRVYFDRAQLRWVAPAGAEPTAKFSREYVASGGPGLLWDGSESGQTDGTLTFTVPTEVFVAAQALHASAEVTVFGTDFTIDAQRSLQSLSHEPLNGNTRCREHQQPRSENWLVTCESTRAIDDCWDLRVPADGTDYLNWTSGTCRRPDYAPWPIPVWRDSYYSGMVGQFSIKDRPSAGGAYGAAAARNAADSIVLRAFKPAGHFLVTLDFSADAAIESAGARVQSRDGVGEAARFANPSGIVTDRRGDLFIVDSADSVIRKVTPTGEVTTFAGRPGQTGVADGPGPDARFDHPHAIAIDKSDDLFVIDSGNSTIRKINPAGTVSTVSLPTSAGAPRQPLHLRVPDAIEAGTDGSLYVIVDSGKNVHGRRVNSGVRTLIEIAPDGGVRTLAGPPALREDTGQ